MFICTKCSVPSAQASTSCSVNSRRRHERGASSDNCPSGFPVVPNSQSKHLACLFARLIRAAASEGCWRNRWPAYAWQPCLRQLHLRGTFKIGDRAFEGSRSRLLVGASPIPKTAWAFLADSRNAYRSIHIHDCLRCQVPETRGGTFAPPPDYTIL